MTQIPVKSLYNQDFALWVMDTVNQLKQRNFHDVDWENLIEEVEFLVRRERRELESRLTTLFEYILKRRYVPLVEDYQKCENTIKRTQKDLKKLLQDSPSLRNYCLEILAECYTDAVDNLSNEYDINFPNVCPFPEDIDILLNHQMWEHI